MLNERTFFGGEGEFMTVRHLTLSGTNFEIGRKLGLLARERYGTRAHQLRGLPAFARSRRRFFQQSYPIHWERLRGVASAFDLDANDDHFDLAGLTYHMDVPMAVVPPMTGCSVIYYPPATTATGTGALSRNYDFPIGTIADLMQRPLPVQSNAPLRPLMSEPYVMSWYPEDGGYASIAMHAFDLLSGTLDGMNSTGLVVSILADEEAIAALGPRFEPHAAAQQAIGVHELQAMRFVLDTCATAEEAKVALLSIKQYYRFAPCHYIVADRNGNSFIYENSTGRNVQHVFDGGGRLQVVTNHQICTHGTDIPDVGALTFENNSLWRYRVLRERLERQEGPFTAHEIRSNNQAVNVSKLLAALPAHVGSGIAVQRMARTVWHSIYDQEAMTADISFYLGDEQGDGGPPTDRRSEYLPFTLYVAN